MKLVEKRGIFYLCICFVCFYRRVSIRNDYLRLGTTFKVTIRIFRFKPMSIIRETRELATKLTHVLRNEIHINKVGFCGAHNIRKDANVKKYSQAQEIPTLVGLELL